MGRCHVSSVPFFIFQHLLSISLFFWSFLSSQSSLFGESLLSRWIFMQFEGGSKKVGPPSERSRFPTGFACCPHFMDPHHSCFWLNSAIFCTYPSLIVCPCIIGMDHLPSNHHGDFFIYLMFTFR